MYYHVHKTPATLYLALLFTALCACAPQNAKYGYNKDQYWFTLVNNRDKLEFMYRYFSYISEQNSFYNTSYSILPDTISNSEMKEALKLFETQYIYVTGKMNVPESSIHIPHDSIVELTRTHVPFFGRRRIVILDYSRSGRVFKGTDEAGYSFRKIAPQIYYYMEQ